MPSAFAEADLVVARAGAGSVNEIAAGGMASVLVPLPFAADDHQRRNAEAFVQAGAAVMVLDAELTGQRLFEEVERLRQDPAGGGANENGGEKVRKAGCGLARSRYSGISSSAEYRLIRTEQRNEISDGSTKLCFRRLTRILKAETIPLCNVF